MSDWQEKSKQNALICLQKMEIEFEKGVKAAATFLPENNGVNRGIIINHFIDLLVGFVVSTVAKYGDATEQVEQAILDSVKFKFDRIRNPSLIVGPDGK